MKTRPSSAAIIALLAMIVTGNSQEPPRTGVYQIESGNYREEGGFVGAIGFSLPYLWQTYVSLNIDSGGTAQLSFLGRDRETAFYISLTNGIVSSNTIRFQYQTSHPYVFDTNLTAQVDYTVTNSAGHLWITGSMSSAVACCDIPDFFGHSNVVATFVPDVSLVLSNGVRLSWTSASNQNYQAQWAADLSQSAWSNLGNVIPGNGTTNSMIDTPTAGQWQRFYRVTTPP